MTTIGYATLQIIPSLRGVSAAINRATRDLTISARVGAVSGGEQAGRRAGGDIRRGLNEARIADGLGRQVEQELSPSSGSRIGSRFGASIGAAILGGLRGIKLDGGLSGMAEAGKAVTDRMGSIGKGALAAAFAARGLSRSLTAAGGALGMLSGGGLLRIAGGLRLVSSAARGAGRDIGRVTASLVTLIAVGRGLSTLNRLGKIAAVGTIGFSALLGVVTALATSIGGPLVAALAAAGAAMAVAAGAAAGILGPAFAAVKIAFKGLGDGVKAYDASQKAGASTAKASAAAAKQVEQAEKAVERSKRDSRDAERDLTRARKEAQEQLEDMNLALRGSALSEKDAQLSLLEAHRDLQNLGKDGAPVDMIDRERAVLRVQEAEQRLAETQESNGDLAEKADEANRQGVEGSDQVVAAKQRVADANEAIIEAEERLAEARQAAADAASGGESSVDPFDAMIGQRMAPMLDAAKNLKHAVTDQFSAALTPGFATLGGLLDKLSPKLSGLSTLFGQIGNDVANSLAGPVASKGFDDMTEASTRFFSAFKGESGIGGLASGLIAFAGTAGKTFAGLGGGINETLLSWGEKLRKITPEMLTASFQQLRQVITNIGNVIGPIFSGLRQLGAITAPALAPGFKDIGHAIAQATPGVMSMARELMPALSKVMTNLAPLLPSLVNAFTPWSTVIAVIAPHLATVVAHLGPLAPLIVTAALAAKGLGIAVVACQTAMAAASIAQGVFTAATGGSTAALAGNNIALGAHRIALVAGAIAQKAVAAATGLWTGAQWLLNAALDANPIGLVVLAIAALVGGIIYAYNHSETFRKIVDAAWKGIKAAAEAVVNWFVDTAWPFLKKVWEAIGDGWNWLVETAEKVWNGVKDHFTSMVNFVTSLPEKITAGAKGMWDGLKNGLLEVLRWIADKWNSLAEKLSFDVPSWVPEIGGKKFYPMPKIPQFDVGGYTGNVPIDQIAGVVHGREWVVKADSADRIESDHPGLLDHMNKTGQLPGYAEGGRVSADGLTQFAKGVEGKPYDWGGVNWGDCSGAVSAIANYATGREPFGSRFATGTEGAELSARGFKSGLGPSGSLNVGWFNGGPYGGHTAATLPNGTHFEMGGNRGNGQYGGGAAGAEDRQFTDHAHLPKEYFTGLDAGAPTTGIGSGVGGSALQSITDSSALNAEAGTGTGSASKASVPTSLSGLSSWGLDGLGVDTQTPTGTRRFEFGKAAGAAVSGQVSSLLGVFGVPDSPGWLDGLSKLAGGISIGGSTAGLGTGGFGSSHGGTGAAPGPLDEQNRLLYDEGGWLPEGMTVTENKTGGPEAILTQSMWGVARDGIDIAMKMAKGFLGGGAQQPQQPMAPPVTYNIQARDTEDAFARARRQEDERAAAKLSRF